MADWETKEIRELKVGRYVNIDDEPCKIVSIDTSKPGKHGSAKANIVATSIFTGAKKSLVGPVSTKCQVPLIDKRKATILYTNGSEVSVLDAETNQEVVIEINDDHECSLEPGAEILYIVAMDRMKLL
ncbi:MAG: translation initiation factor IF-5A [Methanomassiliicoccales archaeon]|uniref:translation initiation factor IF-5A n=1 Tax=Candidatus Methanarcanum hacksteinii TaxID=2911857 RepID=UPI0015A7FC69|nr:translation initiation factor IF-5A [Candidatus Methanomethylophilaceae archaeon]MCI6025216.1 translation initiation factor IF-5A [Methanomassiliicoccales archaeon]MDY4580440.1 translation initiation factor IF-5A [Candidatus Methanarcanum hacksteinii]MDD7479579.1 translation initiation factor IF-5A [Methanomassiliicoccales archaeon]MDO5837188.1 translation initiation factor IF-5A [Methanomassiliicoccales archaeon]